MPFELPPDYFSRLEDEEELLNQQQQQPKPAQQQQPTAPTTQTQPKPQETTPKEKERSGEVQGIQKWAEENIAIPIIDMLDGSRNAEEVARDRAEFRKKGGRLILSDQDKFAQLEEDLENADDFGSEAVKALAGGLEDALEGAVNLPGDLLSVIPGVPDDFLNVDFNLVRKNNTTAGDAVRTLTRYLVAARWGSKLTGGKLTAGQTGAGLFAGRGAQGFIEDFIGADGTAEDDTLIGRTPWTSWLQTSDRNNPLVNRAIVGFEGAIFEAALLPAAGELLKITGLTGVAKNAFGAAASNVFERIQGWVDYGNAYLKGSEESLKLGKKGNAAYRKVTQEILETFYGDGKELREPNQEQLQALFRRADKSGLLTQVVEDVAGKDDSLKEYLVRRLLAQDAAEHIDEVYDTVKYGGAPDEQVVDGFELSGVNNQLDDLDANIRALEVRASQVDDEVATFSEELTRQSSAGPARTRQIQELQTRSMDAPRLEDVKREQLAIPMNLSAGQVRYINELRKLKNADGKLAIKFPRGITITPGRRVKGLTSENVDEFIEIINKGPDGQVKSNLQRRLSSVDRPQVDDFGETLESLTDQIKTLQAEEASSGATAATTRQYLQPSLEEQIKLRQQIAEAKLEREAIYSKINGQEAEFKAKAENLKAAPEPDLPAEVVDNVVRKADETIQSVPRRQALEEGANVDQLIPIRPRAEFGTNPDPVSGVNTAKPGKMTLTEADTRSIARDSDGLVTVKRLASSLPRFEGATNKEILEAMMSPEVERLRKEMLEAFDDGGWDDFVAANPNAGDLIRDKYFILSVPGQTAMTRILQQTVKDINELSQTIFNQTKDGAPEAIMNLERLNERFLAMFNLFKQNNGARGSLLRELDVISRNTGEPIRPGTNPLYDELVARQQELLAQQDIIYKQTMAIGEELRTNPQAAARKLKRAVDALALQHALPTNQVNVYKTLLSANLKNLDGFYITSILSGPATQSRNFWGNFYQAFGHPLMAQLGTYLPGKGNKQVRLEAAAAFAASRESLFEFTDLFKRIWNRNVQGLDPDNNLYTIWDEDLTQNMAQIMEMQSRGELNVFQEMTLGFAVNMRKILMSPVFQPMMRVMGSVDSYFKVVAGRQVVAKRAVMDALDQLGDRPLTGKAADEFAELVQTYKKKHELDIFAEDQLTLIDPEAEDLAQVFTFQKPLSQTDEFTKRLNAAASIPGMRLMGLTFVKTPSEILKASFNLTPGLSSILKSQDAAYKTGTPYYRAVRDGQEAMSYVIGFGAMSMGMAGALTGAGPLDKDQNDKWRKAGNKPFTLKLPGGFEINYQGLEPATTILGTFADIGAISVGHQEASILGAISSNIVNKSYLTQLSTMAEVITADSEKDVGRIGENIARGLVPYSGARSQIGQVIDPVIREYRARHEPTWSWYLKKNAGLGSTMALPERLDPLTAEPLTRDGSDGLAGSLGALFNMASPLGLRFSMNRTDPVHKKLYEWGFDIEDRNKEIDNVDLTNEEMTEFTRLRASNGAFKKAFLDYFNSDQYTKIDKPTSDQDLANGVDKKDTDVYKELTRIQRAYSSAAQTQMKLGLTSPSASYRARYEEALQKRLGSSRDRDQRINQQRFPGYFD